MIVQVLDCFYIKLLKLNKEILSFPLVFLKIFQMISLLIYDHRTIIISKIFMAEQNYQFRRHFRPSNRPYDFLRTLKCSQPIRDSEIKGSTQSHTPKPVIFKHKRKFLSCDESPEMGVLSIKKEPLKNRKEELIAIKIRSSKIKLKQKTECYNLSYLQKRKQKNTTDWIKYNIQVGVYLIWLRIKNNISMVEPLTSIKYFEGVKAQIENVNQRLLKWLNRSKLQNSNQFFHNTMISQKRRNQIGFDQKLTKKLKVSTEVTSRSNGGIKSFQLCFGENIKQQQKQQLNQVKKSIINLNATLCLLQRKIAFKKQTKFMEQFKQNTANKMDKNKITAKQISQLQQILQVNNQRFQLIEELLQKNQKLNELKGNILLTSDQVKQIQQLNLQKHFNQALENEKNEAVIEKIVQTIKSIISIASSKEKSIEIPTKKSKNCFSKKALKMQNLCRNEEPKKSVRIKTRQSKLNRASIQMMIGDFQSINNDSSIKMVSSKKKTKFMTKNVFTSQKTQIKEMADNPLEIMKLSKRSNSKSKLKTKKSCAFAEDVCEINQNNPISFKSIKQISSKRSIKIIQNYYLQTERNVLQKFKSNRTIKTVKSITSNGSYGSIKQLRSLKTQRQLKFLKGKWKKVAGIRQQKSKIFKNNGDVSKESRSSRKEMLNLTSHRLQFSEEDSDRENITSLHHFFHQKTDPRNESNISMLKEPKSKSHYLHGNSKKNLKNNIMETNNKLNLTENSNRKIIRKTKRIENSGENSGQKGNIIRNFLSICKNIEENKQNIIKQKDVFIGELIKLYESGVITEQIFEKYKVLIRPKVNKLLKNQSKQIIQDQENTNMIKNSPYKNLINLRERICVNKRLSQINKYYYNFHQFQQQAQAIGKTKQMAVKDEELFNIKTYVETRKNPLENIDAIHLNNNVHSENKKLSQKSM